MSAGQPAPPRWRFPAGGKHESTAVDVMPDVAVAERLRRMTHGACSRRHSFADTRARWAHPTLSRCARAATLLPRPRGAAPSPRVVGPQGGGGAPPPPGPGGQEVSLETSTSG